MGREHRPTLRQRLPGQPPATSGTSTAAYSVGGPQCTVRAVQDLTGLRIDRVIGIDFAGFKNMVDALGGITVNVCGRSSTRN